MLRLPVLLVSFFLSFPALAQSNIRWEWLLEGNARYRAGSLSYDHLRAQRYAFDDYQRPKVAVVSCADSRVPPELIFDQSVGDVFVVRAAGNIVDEFGLGSIEYAVLNRWTQLIVVMGHEHCGAVAEALKPEPAPTPSLAAILTRIRKSFEGHRWEPDDPERLRKAIEANTRASAAYLTTASEVVRKAVQEGRVRIVPAYYWLRSGEVKALE